MVSELQKGAHLETLVSVNPHVGPSIKNFFSHTQITHHIVFNRPVNLLAHLANTYKIPTLSGIVVELAFSKVNKNGHAPYPQELTYLG